MAQETLSPANEGSALRTQLEQLTRAIAASLSDGAAGHAVGKDFLSLHALVWHAVSVGANLHTQHAGSQKSALYLHRTETCDPS